MDQDILNELENKMKQASENRSKLLKEAESNMDAHSRKMVEYDQKVKSLELLEVKYKHLLHESQAAIENSNKKIEELVEENKNLKNEVTTIKRTIINFKSKANNLQSVIELIINDFGIDQVSLATGLEKDKLKEYLKD